ncbi:hypothetical protein [Mycobacteroides abscessus]|uniref:hypothetical protein n=1 Tax=Mycobacteroides abscessus TaxID=36809 RepID=UPI000929E6A6|nr:hypothetical protein [Mycobacteroides abscessus]SIC20163.1 Uncharacterised protein [Mycobacteroides abscessus subsp. abscessus]
MLDRWVGVSCDSCGAAGDILENAKAARAAAKKVGWTVQWAGGRELCPACSAARPQS